MKPKKSFPSAVVVSFLIIISIFLSGNFIFAQSLINSPIEGLNESANEINAFKNQTGDSDSYNNFLQTKAGQIIGIVLSFVGVLFLILMIYAGILWMTAQGNEQQVAKAKGLLINGTIGLIIVFAAYAITSFIGTEILR
jgi:amino acid transporter